LVYRWDLDKTYLRTEFDTLRDLLRTAFETAAQKRTVPGATALLRELSSTEPLGIHIVSGSPEQLRRVLEAKLRLDGIRWDSLTLKPQVSNLLRGRFRYLKEQVGYKLGSLLETRAAFGPEVDEFMFGDDAEADAFIYSLYADLCAGRVDAATLEAVLERAGVYEDAIPRVLASAARVPRHDGGRRVFIHLDRVSSPAAFDEYGPRVCPFYNYFQPALVLLEQGAISGLGAVRVAAELVVHHGFTADALLASYEDLVARATLGGPAAGALLEALDTLDEARFARSYPVLLAFRRQLAARAKDLAGVAPDPEPPAIDYVALFARDRDRARQAKQRITGR
jgi:hypothetical protein